MNSALRVAPFTLALCLAFGAPMAFAQESAQDTEVPHAHPPAKQPATAGAQDVPATTNAQQKTHAMPGMDMPPVHSPPAALQPALRSADYSDGIGYATAGDMEMHDDAPLGKLLVDSIERFDGRADSGIALDAQAWYGNDANKLWLKAVGERAGGRLQDLRTEALWDHPLTAFWDTQAGVRHDFGGGPDRTWAAFGVQGLAPYWFEIEATLYVGSTGRSAFRFESEYELLLTQRLIVQPRFEANLYGRNDPQRGIGSGLSDAELGVRLRYEFTRQFAPYVGLEFARRFGQTARFVRDAGGSAFDVRAVVGLRLWF